MKSDRELIALAKTKNLDAIAKKLHRPPSVILRKAKRLGLSIKRSTKLKMKLDPRPSGRPWTPEEDAQLLALLESKMERPSIALKLKRTVNAITIRLMVLRGKMK